MKRGFFLKAALAAVMVFLLAPAVASAQTDSKAAVTVAQKPVDPYATMTRSQKRMLKDLWEIYDLSTRYADRESALLQIKRMAAEGGFSKDYYKAGAKLVVLRENRNWKDSESERNALKKELEEKGYILESCLDYNQWYFENYQQQRMEDAVLNHADALRMRRSSPWYSDYDYPPAKETANDYVFLLWKLLYSNASSVSDKQRWENLLQQELGGRYPYSQFAEYLAVPDSAGYVAFKEKYAGRGVSLLAEAWLIRHEKQVIDAHELSDDAPCRALRERCNVFDADKRQFSKKGDEGARRAYVYDVKYFLDYKETYLQFNDSSMLVIFQNISGTKIKLKGKDFSWSRTVDNPTCRYYLKDTVRIPLPDVPDGYYSLKTSSKGSHVEESSRTQEIYSLAVALRNVENFVEFYVADSKTGRPVDSLSIWVARTDTVFSEKKLRPLVADFRMDGFTPIPESFRQIMADSLHSWKWWVTTTDSVGKVRRTQAWRVEKTTYQAEPDSGMRGALYLDHTVVQRGETVQFKGIAWMKEKDGTRHTLKEGVNLKAVLQGPKNAKGDTLTLQTNAFGSVAGSFRLPDEATGGNWQVILYSGGRYLASASCAVGDIVLPTFDVAFDPMTEVSLPGEDLTVSGKVTYLSCHAASGALVKWSASGKEAETRCDENGRFTITLRDSLNWAYLLLDVTSAEGETRTFSRHYNRSLSLSAKIENPGGGQTSGSHTVVSDDQLRVRFTVPAPDGSDTHYPVSWQLKARSAQGWTTVQKGVVPAGGQLTTDLSNFSEREFRIEGEVMATSALGKVYNNTVTHEIYRISADDQAVYAPIDWYLEKLPGKGVSARIGAGAGDIWAIAELWGTNLLNHTVRYATKRIHLSGKPGDPNSLQTIDFGLDSEWSENLILTIHWFKDRRLVSRQLAYTVPTQQFPADYVRFTEGINPGAQTTVTLKTLPGTEGVATVYDKAMEAVRVNRWTAFGNEGRSNIFIPNTARNTGRTWVTPSDDVLLGDVRVIAYGIGRKRLFSRSVETSGSVASANSVEYEMTPMYALAKSADTRGDLVADESAAEPEPESLRSDLAPVLAFEPFLHPDAEGNISFTVKASDRLSQFVVRTLVHDRSARSAVVERLMTVTLPVKVGLLPPALLHTGDRIAFAASAANSSEVPVSGQLSLRLYDGRYTPGAAPLKTLTKEVSVAAGSTLGIDFQEIPVPGGISDTLGILVAFTSDGATDALSLAVPVQPRSKQITETHSMLLRGGEDLAAARAALEARFQNAAPGSIVFEERTIAEMLDRLEQRLCRYEREDAISLAGALLVKTLLGQPTDSLAQKLAACQNADGGYGWMKGMDSSPYVTAMLLDRFARIDKRDGDTRRAIQWLDSVCLGEKKVPWWRGGVSMPIYLYIRSLFPELPIVGKTSYARNEEARDWLNPNKMDRKYDFLYDRALRARTLLNMTASDQGVDLAKFFGFTFFAERKLRKSLEKEAEYLLDYAVEHPSGGWYYPNLVMPWRGLMESEAYAHTFMCDILRDIAARSAGEGGSAEAGLSRQGLSVPPGGTPKPGATGGTQTTGTRPTAAEIADGIRLWLLVQRETQAWTEDPAYAMAIASIREGSPELLETRVLIARSTAELPFEKIKASGNGMKIERQWQVKRGGKWTALSDGTKLRVGETLRSILRLHSDENRSFVVVTAPRPGNLQPVNQISGYAGARGGYRDVRSNRTEYLFDAYPEEKLTLTEEYRVTHAGSFTYAPAEIVCTYADHYRATDRHRPDLASAQPQK